MQSAISFLPRDAIRKRGLCCRPVSVRLSAWHVGGLYPHCWRYRQTSCSASCPHHSSFWLPAPIPNSKGNLFSGGVKYMGWMRKICDFDWNSRLSRKRCCCYRKLIGSHKRRIDPCRFRWPWVTPNPGFKVTVYYKSNISKTVRLRDKVTKEH